MTGVCLPVETYNTMKKLRNRGKLRNLADLKPPPPQSQPPRPCANPPPPHEASSWCSHWWASHPQFATMQSKTMYWSCFCEVTGVHDTLNSQLRLLRFLMSIDRLDGS